MKVKAAGMNVIKTVNGEMVQALVSRRLHRPV